MVNDICGFADPKMPEVCDEYDVAVAKMASPPDLEAPGAIEDVDDIYDALELNGLTDKTIIDPAFGGWSEDKTVEDDRETFRRLREFRGYGHPILVSINRKNFLRSVAGRDTEGALPVSLAATAMAVERGAHIIRTHDVAETRDAALIGKEFSRERLRETSGGVAVEELDITTQREAERHLDRYDAADEAADDSVTRTFELTGLAPDSRDRLLNAVGETTVTAVSGTSDNALVLIGTPAGFESLTRRITGDSSQIAATVERISERCC
jgi:dihydropteroate synthase